MIEIENKTQVQDELENIDIQDINDDTDFQSFIGEIDRSQESNKFPNKYAKILHQRNEAKKQAEEYAQKLKEFENIDINNIQNVLAQNQEMAQYKVKTEFLSQYPDAKNVFDKVNDFVNQNPSISFENAYKIIKFEHLNDAANINKSVSKKSNLLGNTPSSLRKFKAFDAMDSSQQFEYLKNQFKSGKIII